MIINAVNFESENLLSYASRITLKNYTLSARF